MKKLLLFIPLIIITALTIFFFLDKAVSANGSLIYIIFLLVAPLSSLVDFLELQFGITSENFLEVGEKNERILRGYVMPLLGLILIFWFLEIKQASFNEGFHENFSKQQIHWLNVTIGMAAIISLAAQVGHLLISLSTKFIQYKFGKYLLLFFLSYLTCGLSFAVIYYLDVESFKNINPTSRTLDFIYFSFVTLSTTGYGDIVPTSAISKIFVIIENLTGLFLTGYVITMIFSSTRKTT